MARSALITRNTQHHGGYRISTNTWCLQLTNFIDVTVYYGAMNAQDTLVSKFALNIAKLLHNLFGKQITQ